MLRYNPRTGAYDYDQGRGPQTLWGGTTPTSAPRGPMDQRQTPPWPGPMPPTPMSGKPAPQPGQTPPWPGPTTVPPLYPGPVVSPPLPEMPPWDKGGPMPSPPLPEEPQYPKGGPVVSSPFPDQPPSKGWPARRPTGGGSLGQLLYSLMGRR